MEKKWFETVTWFRRHKSTLFACTKHGDFFSAPYYRENFRVRTFCHVHHLIKGASINGFSG